MSFPYWQVLSMHMHFYLFYSQTNASNVQLALCNITADPEERHDLNKKTSRRSKVIASKSALPHERCGSSTSSYV